MPEFKEMRAAAWPKYIRALRALSDTMSNLATQEAIDLHAERIIGELKVDLEKQRGERFQSSLVDQAVFSLWTLGKMRAMGSTISAVGRPNKKDKKADLELQSDFRLCSLWAQFHLDSAIAAMKFRKTIPVEIQSEICDGLRALVNAYAIMKEALSLRVQTESANSAELPWDEEDERLLAASMRDLNDFSNPCGS